MSKETDNAFLHILHEDVTSAIKRHVEKPTQGHRRELVRTVFAAIEGIAWTYRMHIVESARVLDELEPMEEIALTERVPTVSSKGEVIEQVRFIPLLPSIRLVSGIAWRLSENAAIDFSDNHWSELKLALDVRHRLTHPKSHEDLQISDDEAQACASAFIWLLARSSESMASTNKALAEHLGDAADVLDRLKNGEPSIVSAYAEIEKSQRGTE